MFSLHPNPNPMQRQVALLERSQRNQQQLFCLLTSTRYCSSNSKHRNHLSRCASRRAALPAVSFLPSDHQGRPLQHPQLTGSQPSPPGSDAASTSPGSWMSSQRLSGVNVHPSLPSTTSYTLPKPVLPKVCPYEQLRISSSGIQG